MTAWFVTAATWFGLIGTTLGAASAVRTGRRIRVLRRIDDGAARRARSETAVPDPVARVLTELAPTADPRPRWWLIRAVVASTLVAALLQAPLTVIVLVGAPGLAIALHRWTASRVSTAGTRLGADHAERLATRIATGADAHAALRGLADEAPDWVTLADDLDRGLPLQEALDRWADGGVDDADRRLLADVWAVAGTTGAGIAPALLRAASTLRERIEIDREIEALTAQARLSARVLTIVPVAFAALVAAVDDRVAGFLLTTVAGQFGIVVGLVLSWAGSRWMNHLVEGAR